MNLIETIHWQIKGFFKAGKRLQSPKDKQELFASRVFATILLFFMLFFYFVVFGLGLHIPARLHIRALIYVIPAIAFIVQFYKGISLSWMFKGLLKYWLFTSLLLYIVLILFKIYMHIFTGKDLTDIGYWGGVLLLAVGVIFTVYFRMEALQLTQQNEEKKAFRSLSFEAKSKFIFFNLLALLYSLFIFGGIWMFLWQSGIGDWFFESVLGW
jgi:hypothetical protein